MALLETPALDKTLQAPDFTLKNVDGRDVSLTDAMGKNGTVIAFICNHCPFVVHIIDSFCQCAKDYQDHNIAFIAIWDKTFLFFGAIALIPPS